MDLQHVFLDFTTRLMGKLAYDVRFDLLIIACSIQDGYLPSDLVHLPYAARPLSICSLGRAPRTSSTVNTPIIPTHLFRGIMISIFTNDRIIIY